MRGGLEAAEASSIVSEATAEASEAAVLLTSSSEARLCL